MYDQKFRGIVPEKLGGDVRHASWNPYPFSDQNLWFSLPYFRPDQKFDTLFKTWRPVARRVTGARDKLLRYVHGQMMKWRLILLKSRPNSRLEYTNHTLFQTKMVEIDTLFQTKTAKKT